MIGLKKYSLDVEQQLLTHYYKEMNYTVKLQC